MSNSYQDWVNRSQSCQDQLPTFPARALAATLDRNDASLDSEILPPLWHWLYFLRPARQSDLDQDGHGKRGGFLPPIELPRRMWAGSRIQFLYPLRLQDVAEQTSTIQSITSKQGRSGELIFVTVIHETSQSGKLCIKEEQDLVFRDHPNNQSAPTQAIEATQKADFSKTIRPDPTLLFRYSALTFNSHRIHYDRDYATKVENYPGLLVHGPLMATLLLELLAEHCPQRPLASFSFKALAPVFDLEPFKVCGSNPDEQAQSQLWIENSTGELCLQAQATLK